MFIPIFAIILSIFCLFKPSNAIDLHLANLRNLMETITSMNGTRPCAAVQKLEQTRNISVVADARHVLADGLINITAQLAEMDKAITKMKVQNNKLTPEALLLVEEGKKRSEEMNQREKRLAEIKISLAQAQQEYQILQQIEQAETENLQRASDELKQINQEGPPVSCVDSCLIAWNAEHDARVQAANVTYQEALKRREEAAFNRGSKYGSLYIRSRDAGLGESSLRSFKAYYEQLIGQIANSTNLRSVSLNLLESLTTLKIFIIDFEQQLRDIVSIFKKRQCAESDQEIWLFWNITEQAFEQITSYINNDGFINDVQAWGIQITGFDIPSLKKLGIQQPDDMIRLINM